MLYENKKTGKVGEFIEKNEKSRIVMLHVEGKPVAVSFSTFDRWWKKLEEEPKKAKKGKRMPKKEKAKEKVTWEEIVEKFTAHNDAQQKLYAENPDGYEHKTLRAVIVIDPSGFTKDYTEEERSYYVDSDNYGFISNDRRTKIAIDAVDGTDPNVGLHTMMKEAGWKVEYGYYVDSLDE